MHRRKKIQCALSLFDEIENVELLSDASEEEECIASDVEDVAEAFEFVCYDGAQQESDDDDDITDSVQIDWSSPEFTAPDGTKWYSQPTTAHKNKQQNVSQQKCGPVRKTATMSILETFKSFMTPDMIDIIIRNTNKKAQATFNAMNLKHEKTESKTWKNITLNEMYGFLGLLIMSGANRSNHECMRDLWSIESYPLYRAAMSINRFRQILRFIRFDNSNTRSTRLQTDKAAPISELWGMMNHNFQELYKPSENLTVDEQLFPYRGETRFSQYIPSKPAKYGIKVWWVCDAKNSYPLHGQISTEDILTGQEFSQSESIVKDLVRQFNGSGRTITMNQKFTTLDLLRNLWFMNLKAVGTLSKSKPYIPREMLPHKKRDVKSTSFAFMTNVTMCSYVHKRNKAEIFLSTMHDDYAIGENGKPEIMEFYNKTKDGVNRMDKMLGAYTCQRQTKRWPLSLFCNMVDLTTLAAYIIYFENSPTIHNNTLRRKHFMRQLAKELCMPVIQERSVNQQVLACFSTKLALASYVSSVLEPKVCARPEVTKGERVRKQQVGICYICKQNAYKRNTRNLCATCDHPICLQHSTQSYVCDICNNANEN